MPWNQRKALLTHHRWFKNLTDFHAMTRSWLEDTHSEKASYHLERLEKTSAAHSAEDFKLLETLPDARLESLLDDTSPEDLLKRLEYSVWTAQAWTYTSLLGRAAQSSFSEGAAEKLTSVLEQATWKQGRAVAEKKWALAEKQDLRALFLTLIDSPIALSLGEDAFLLRRGLTNELEFEFRACPHFSRYPEVIPVADALCFFHSAWVRGYVYGLNHQVQIEYHPCTTEKGHHKEGNRCWQRWKL
jgi:hypothetical protein